DAQLLLRARAYDVKAANKAFLSQYLCDRDLHARRRHLHEGMARTGSIANTRQKVGDWISEHVPSLIGKSRRGLPTGLRDSRDLASKGQLAETDSAQSELPNESSRAAAATATIVLLCLE